MNYNDELRFKHIGSFTLLFFLSVFRPTSMWPDNPIPFLPITLLVLLGILLYKINATFGFKIFWQKYSTILLLVFSYQIICLTSLLVNRNSYSNVTEFVNWGLLFIAVQSALPVSIFLFILPQNKSKFSITRWRHSWLLPLFICLLISFVAIWQKLDNKSAYQLYKYFLAGNINAEENIRSILAVSTDLGAITAIMSLAFIYLFINSYTKGGMISASLIGICTLFCITAGLISGARVFILMCTTGLLCGLFLFSKNNMKAVLASLLWLGLLLILFFLLTPLSTARKLGDIIPAVPLINLGVAPYLIDWFPVLNISSFGDRSRIWALSWDLFLQNPFLGVSNGAFRFALAELGGTEINNTHNIIFQILVDAGILGFLVFIATIFFILQHLKANRIALCLTISTFTGLLVDYFIDHSLPWIFITSWFVANSNSGRTAVVSDCINHRIKFLNLSMSTLAACVIGLFIIKKIKVESTEFVDAIELAYLINSNDYWNRSPILLSQNAALKLETINKIQNINIKMLPVVPMICDYYYPDSIMISLHDEKKLSDRKYNLNNVSFYRWKKSFDSCSLSLSNPLAFENWISNHRNFFNQAIHPERVYLQNEYIDLFSPITTRKQNTQLEFEIRGNAAFDKFPKLSISIINSITGELSANHIFQTQEDWEIIRIQIKPAQFFIKLSMNGYLQDIDRAEYQRIYIKSVKMSQ